MWNAGYMSEVDYVYGYFSELSPTRLKLALLSRGLAPSLGASPTYLELGFGQGLSLNINAATASGAYYGTDFNPSQAAHAAALAKASGKPVTIWDRSFEDLAARDDLPEFDIIALHGIWSWISQSGRDAIIRIVRERLKPGGILYISYNVMPGWSPAVPLRHLLNEHARRAGAGGILARVDQSIAFVEQVIAADAAYFTAHPDLARRLDLIKTQDRHYIAHEYFNRHWQPEAFSDVHDILAEAKLSFGASANIIENMEGVSVPLGAVDLLARIGDDVLRETTKDYFVNQQFRRDIFVKGARRMARAEIAHEMQDLRFVLLGDPEKRPRAVRTPAGEAALLDHVYQPVVAALAHAAPRPTSLRAIRLHDACRPLTEWQVWEALLILVGAGFIAPVAQSETPEEDAAASLRLNREICARARYSGSMLFLAAPVIGSAIAVGRIEQLILLALSEATGAVVDHVWDVLKRQDERLLVDGAVLDSDAQNRARIAELIESFEATQMPILKAVGAIRPERPYIG